MLSSKTRFFAKLLETLSGPKCLGALSFVLKGAHRALRHWSQCSSRISVTECCFRQILLDSVLALHNLKMRNKTEVGVGCSKYSSIRTYHLHVNLGSCTMKTDNTMDWLLIKWGLNSTLQPVPGDPKKLHELDRTYLLESKCYEDKQGISM